MRRIDEIVHDEAFYIPFWTAPYIRLAYWDYVRFPEFYLPKRTEQFMDWLVYLDRSRKRRPRSKRPCAPEHGAIRSTRTSTRISTTCGKRFQ